MRVGLGRFGKSAAIALAGLLAGVSVASAALPPYWQRTREIERIAGDSRVHDALNGSLIVYARRCCSTPLPASGATCCACARAAF